MILSQDRETILDSSKVLLSIENSGGVHQVVAYPYGDSDVGFLMGEYYNKEDAIKMMIEAGTNGHTNPLFIFKGGME